MAHQYTGSDAFPSDYTIPDDLDDDEAAAFNVAYEALGDRTVYLKNLLDATIVAVAERHDLITTSGTWTCPPGVTRILLEIIGGGGAGGGGGGGNGLAGCGGGGGGGAKMGVYILTVVPGTSYTTTIGAAGTAGTAGSTTTAGGDGGDGGDTSFGALATAYGAMGGQRGHVGSGSARQCWGGMPGRSSAAKSAPDTGAVARFPCPGEGGMGINGISTLNSGHDIVRCGGSTAAALGGDGTALTLTSGTGGGGGASEWIGNVPGVGGGGGGAGQPGVVGTAGTLGAGGGGGGAGDSTPTAGAHGGAGGAGAIRVSYEGPQAVIT